MFTFTSQTSRSFTVTQIHAHVLKYRLLCTFPTDVSSRAKFTRLDTFDGWLPLTVFLLERHMASGYFTFR
ncbi:hypothetical protein PM082_024072 [Marasmius tenuissimus]|nr:hypothetical protein PM082_024072 [Marasmius tenuissimus]